MSLILKDAFRIYLLVVYSNFNLLHNSKLITFYTLSGLLLYSFY